MIKNAQLINLLRTIRSYEIAVLAGGEHAQDFRARLQAELNIEVQAGHKRVVVDDPSDPNYVLKIAASYEGVLGNMNEIICYQRICELVDMNSIPVDCKILFAKTEFLDDDVKDPFIIRQAKGITPFKDQTFINFINQNTALAPNANPLEFWPLYISQNERFRADLLTLSNVISEHFAASDINPYLEGLNYAEVIHNGVPRLVLIDMDSCIPLSINSFGQYDRPLCPKCGQPLKYLPPLIGTAINNIYDPRLSKGAYYACMTANCLHNFQNINSDNPHAKGEVQDITVYNKYRLDHMSEILYMYLDKCSYFNPGPGIRTFGDYYAHYMAFKPMAIESEVTVGFNNYINAETANTLSIFWELIQNSNTKQITYFDFRTNLHNIATSRNFPLGPIQFRALAFLYIAEQCAVKGDAYNIFGVFEPNQIQQVILTYTPQLHPNNAPGNPMIQTSYDLLINDLISIY